MRSENLLLLTEELETADAVSAAMAKNGGLSVDSLCRNVRDFAALLQRSPIKVAMVDIDTNPRDCLREMIRLTGQFPRTRFVVLSRDPSAEMMRAAMHAGAREFLHKQSIAGELLGALHRLCPPEADGETTCGGIVTVLSAGGGCGATTLAINIADELHAVCGEPSLLIDMDVHYGAIAAYLGVQGQYGLADALVQSDHIDPQLIRSTAVNYSDGLRLLLSPASVAFSAPAPLNLAGMDRVLEACRQTSRFTVIDAPRVSMETAAALASHSLMTMVVFQLNVKDVTIARSMLMALTERHVSPDKLVPVANRCNKRHCLVSVEDAQRSIGALKIQSVRNDYSSACKAVNFGQPLAQSAKRSAIYEDIKKLSALVNKAHEADTQPKSSW